MVFKTTYLLRFLMITGLFVACKSGFIQSKLPFKLVESSYYTWVGGQPGVRGTNVVIKGLNVDLANFKSDSLYFNNKVVKTETHIKKDTLVVMGYFTQYNPKVVLKLEHDTANPPAKVSNSNPYHLKKDEALLTYFLNGKKQSFKLLHLIEVNKKYYP